MTDPKQIVLASGNRGKVREIGAMLQGLPFSLVLQSDLTVPDIEETGETFVENAIIKARHAARCTGLPAIADDSGIQVDALDGAPGVRSARYAGVGASDEENLRRLLRAAEGLQKGERAAQFTCVMVYLRHPGDPTPIIAQGIWRGLLLRVPVGENGFGYDPIFYVPTHQCSSAQLPPEVKNSLSHRGQALRALVDQLRVEQ
ncbi:MAG: RdgB/HAM1 family non-canonical purine NTP pyrophosphatase [Chromatiales bacterium]